MFGESFKQQGLLLQMNTNYSIWKVYLFLFFVVLYICSFGKFSQVGKSQNYLERK